MLFREPDFHSSGAWGRGDDLQNELMTPSVGFEEFFDLNQKFGFRIVHFASIRRSLRVWNHRSNVGLQTFGYSAICIAS